jgi:putative flippase GtrA
VDSQRRTSISQFIKFNLVGIVNTGLTYLIYSGLVYLGLNYLVALILEYVVGIIFSFFLNKTFTFRVRNSSTWGMFFRMVAVYLIALAVNVGLLRLAVGYWGLNPYFSQVIALGFVSILTFVFQRNFVYRVQHTKD